MQRWPSMPCDKHQVTGWGKDNRFRALDMCQFRERDGVGSEQLETVLAELTRLDDDVDGRRDMLDRACVALLHRPALGGQLVARLCATDETAAELEPLSDLLGAAIDAARVAQENRKKRGKAFLMAVTEAVEMAAGQGRLSPVHRLILARLWTRGGLTAPAALQLSADDLDRADRGPAPLDRAAADAMLDDLFRELITQCDGDALGLHAALTETFPAMPAEMREAVVAWSIERAEPIHVSLACFWLLDPDAPIRMAAARALAEQAAGKGMSADLACRMVMLRSWMPDDAARASVDQAMKIAIRSRLATGGSPEPWTIHSIMATLPDGGGAQSVMIALQLGGSRKLAMLLLKQGYGVKDAYSMPCASATEQRALIKRIVDETGAVQVPLNWLERALPMALADGLAAGLPPAPGLVDVVELCGLSAVRPEPVTTEALIAALPSADRIANLSAQARGKLINASDDWWNRHEIIRSWFEESDHAHEVLEGRQSPRAIDAALWKWLETRRDFWARLVARGADVLAAADHPDAESFTATAMALREGRDLKTIPVMSDVHDQTIEAWVFDDPDLDQHTSLGDWVEVAESASPKPERKGELGRLLEGATISADWIDGFLMSVTVAPKIIAPNRWLPEILGGAMASLDPMSIQRFADLILMRANACVELAEEPKAFAASMTKRGSMAMRDWAAGFSYACQMFKSSWSAKSTSRDDRAMMERVSDAIETGFSGPDAKLLGLWLAARHDQNTRS